MTTSTIKTGNQIARTVVEKLKFIQQSFRDHGATDTEPDTMCQLVLKEACLGREYDNGRDFMLYCDQNSPTHRQFNKQVRGIYEDIRVLSRLLPPNVWRDFVEFLRTYGYCDRLIWEAWETE